MAGFGRWSRRRLLAGTARVGAGVVLGRGLGGRVTLAQEVVGGGSLKACAARSGLVYGAAVDVGLLRADAVYRRVLAEQCGVVVAENVMKWAALRPSADVFRWDEADALMAFAGGHGMAVRGHNLCWHEALPWWFAGAVNSGNAEAVLTGHIRAVVGRYKGRIRAWDVVNEAVLPGDGKAGGLRDSPWLRLLGAGYIDTAFRTARAADPAAMLTYNDYGIEYDDPPQVAKRAAVLELLRGMKQRGVPVDAVGVQSHLTAASPNKLGPGLMRFLDEVRGLGLKVFVTEMDVNDDAVAADDVSARDAAVAAVYREYVRMMVEHPAVTDVLTWGMSDGHTWLNGSKTHKAKHPRRGERALPLDENYAPTLAFFALRDALGSRKA